MLVLLTGLGVVYLTGIDSGTGTFTQLWALEAAVVIAVVAFVALLRHNGAAHEQLASRARLYDQRLAELHHQWQVERAHRATPQHV